MNTRSAGTWLLLAGLLVLAVFAVYANSLHNGFVFDDLDVVVGDPRIRDLTNLRGLFVDAYRPLRSITYAIDYRIWGLNPFGFRLTNVGIHAANVALVLYLARRLTDGALVPSLAAAAIFAVHPVQVESVAYVSGRRDVLFALFYLLGFMAFVRFREATTVRDRAVWLAATGAGFALSLASKEMAASFPLACLVWDVTRATAPDAEGARPSSRAAAGRLLREGAALYGVGLVAVAAFAYYTLVIRQATTRIQGDVEYWGGSLLNNTLTVPLTLSHYARLAVWPQPLAAQYYGAFDPAAGFSDPRVVPAIAFVLGLVALALYLLVATRLRLAGLGILLFFVTLLPASQIVPHHEIVADHYLYLPLVGVGLVVASLLVALARAAAPSWARPVAYGLVAVVVLALAARTVVRDRDFKDEATLWEATYKAVPSSPRAAYNYGLVLTTRGDHKDAIPLYRATLEGDPTFVKAYFNLASTYAGLGRYDEAREVYRKALASDLAESSRTWHLRSPDVLGAMYRTEIAMLDAQTGDTAKARDELAAIVALYPDMLRSEEFYATVLKNRGELETAAAAASARLAATPDPYGDLIVLANLQWKLGRLDDAYATLTRAVAAQPSSVFANFYLAKYYRDVRPSAAPSPGAVATAFDTALGASLTSFDSETIRRERGDASPAPLAG